MSRFFVSISVVQTDRQRESHRSGGSALSMLVVAAVRLPGLTGLTGLAGLAGLAGLGLRTRPFRLLGTRRVCRARLRELNIQLRLGLGHQLVHGRDRAGNGWAASCESAALPLDQGGLPVGGMLIEDKMRAAFALHGLLPQVLQGNEIALVGIADGAGRIDGAGRGFSDVAGGRV